MVINNKFNTPEGNRTFTIIISIVIAFFLWIYVIGEVNPTIEQTITNVPVQLLNVESLTARDLAISGDGEYTVDVIVEGKRSDIMKVSEKEIIAEADLFGWSKGENFIPVKVQVPDAFDIIEVKSPKIQVTIENLVALSKPVTVIFKGEMPQGYEEGEVEIKPSEIEVTGAKTDVQTVSQVQVTVDVSELSQDKKNIQAEAMAVNQVGMLIENVKLSSNYVNVSAKLSKLKEVALKVEMIGKPVDGIDIETKVPDKIYIKGSKNAIKDITSVYAEPVDISEITANDTIPLSLILPDGVEIAKGYEKLQLEVSTIKVDSKVFRYSSDDILIEGLTKGKSVNTDTTSFEVTVSGKKEILSGLTADKLKLYIDVADASIGSMTTKVLVTSTVPLQNISVKPEVINITVKDTE
ncbi:MAG: YbbR-like domain-containing protein [Anaerovoracaceae bacterium]